MSVIIGQAFATYRACRDEYELLRESQYRQASDACNGRLLNRRGVAAGIDSQSLFMGSEVRALAYASPELVEWWWSHPRVTFAEFEKAWFGREH